MAARSRALATPEQIAEYLATSPQQLAQLRYKGVGPKFIKIGAEGRKGSVRYRWEDVDAWLDENTRVSTGAA